MKSALQDKLILQGLLIEVLENSFCANMYRTLQNESHRLHRKKYRYFYRFSIEVTSKKATS